MSTWNWLTLELRPRDRLLLPTVGPGGMDRVTAHAAVLRMLTGLADRQPAARKLVAEWVAGAKDDTVFAGTWTWAIYEADDPMEGAREWVADYARTLRKAGLMVGIGW